MGNGTATALTEIPLSNLRNRRTAEWKFKLTCVI